MGTCKNAIAGLAFLALLTGCKSPFALVEKLADKASLETSTSAPADEASTEPSTPTPTPTQVDQSSTDSTVAKAFRINEIKGQEHLWFTTAQQMRDLCWTRYQIQIGVPKGYMSYQGDYRTLTSDNDADELVCRIANYKLIVFTNAFAVYPKDDPIKPAGYTNDHQDPYFVLQNGNVAGATYYDKHLRGLFYVIYRLRQLQGMAIEIYGYVPATLDNPDQTLPNFSCPNYNTCSDFYNMVQKWRGLEKLEYNTWLDGFFIDLFNEAYAHPTSILNMVLGIRNSGSRYKLFVNTASTGWNTYSTGAADGAGRPIQFTFPYLKAGDIVGLEGFYLAAGKATAADELERIRQDLALRPPGVRWAAIVSEKGYVPPLLMPGYNSYRESLSSIYRDYASTNLDAVYATYINTYPTMLLLNPEAAPSYGKDGISLSKYLVDYNVVEAARISTATGQGMTSDNLCDYVEAYFHHESHAQRSCRTAAQIVSCTSTSFEQVKSIFYSWGGSFMLYDEANLGSLSGRLTQANCTLSQ